MAALPFSSLNLNLLLALDALLETRSVRRTAGRLGVTQSAVSHSLRELRAALGDELLVRVGNGMLPTPRAEAIAAPLREALATLRRVVEHEARFDPAGSARRFVVATTDALAVAVFPALVGLVRASAPRADLAFVALEWAAVERRLAAGEIDLAVGPGPAGPGLEAAPLFATDFVVLARADHPALGGRLDLDTYCALPHALVAVTGSGPGVVDEALAKLGRARRVALRVPYFLAAPALLSQSDLLLTLPRVTAEHFVARYALTLYELPFALPAGVISMAWHRRYARDEGLAWLRARVGEAAKGLPPPAPARGARRAPPARAGRGRARAG
ncbi:MAG TPA: LysR family transcriptional regulator [Polyangiaceae bacterium]|nr:LysR family transcriptional regulator [Polyangiaceae bacterium]